MPDLNSIEDEAARYVLGEMSTTERREFEVRLERSAELRAVVRELEEGAVALATASPQRRPPSELWQQIGKAVDRERRRKIGISGWWVGWVRSGWAAATICVVGWVLYALWVKPSSPANVSPTTAVAEAAASRAAQISDSRGDEHRDTTPTTRSNIEFSVFQAKTQELSTLRQQIAELEYRLTRVSQTVTQQQALLSESNRIKFFQLTSGTGDGNDGANLQSLSPQLQWALYTAMARELGWRLPASASGRAGGGVDYVDLRPATNNAANPATQSPPQTELASASAGSLSNNTVAGFISGASAFLAFDSQVAPVGSSLAFWMTGASGYQSLGNTIYGNNLMVVTIPASAGGGEVSYLTITATTPSGVVTNVGHVSLPSLPSP